MSSGLKVIFETSKGERVERALNVIWATDVCRDLKKLRTESDGEDIKQIISKMVADAITTEFVMDVLTEFEKRTT